VGDEKVTVIIAYSKDLSEIGTTQEVPRSEAAAMVTEGRARYAAKEAAGEGTQQAAQQAAREAGNAGKPSAAGAAATAANGPTAGRAGNGQAGTDRSGEVR
jgi:hypothetical protein